MAISDLLHDAGETHHLVYKIVDGNDLDWSVWYADWLINLSNLSSLLGKKPLKSELIYLLVKLDKEYLDKKPNEKWEYYYAKEMLEYFQ